MRSLVLPLLLLLAGCARPLGDDAALTSIPYELRTTGRVVIEVTINDQGPFRFGLDTASSGTFIFSDAAGQLGLVPVPELEANVRGAVAAGTFPIVEPERLQLGDELHTDVRMTLLPGDTIATSNLDGILGADFMRQYAVGFSVRDNRIRLYAPERVRNRSYRGYAEIPLRPARVGASDEPLYYLDVEIAGSQLPALFDLGAGLNLMNRAAAEFLNLGTMEPAEEVEFAGALENRPVYAQFDMQAITTGEVDWHNEIFLISDIEVFATLGYEQRPLAILGSGLFTQRDFVIDFARQRLLIRVAMSELAVAPTADNLN